MLVFLSIHNAAPGRDRIRTNRVRACRACVCRRTRTSDSGKHENRDDQGLKRGCWFHDRFSLARKRDQPRPRTLFGAWTYDKKLSPAPNKRLRALCALAKTLWLRGYSDQAARVARHTVEEAEALEQPVTLCISLMGIGPVFLWIGDLSSAQEITETLIEHAKKHSLAPCYATGIGLKGELALRRGEAKAGVQLLRACLEDLHVDRYESRRTVFLGVLAEGLAMTGQFDLSPANSSRFG
jgi:hypothetical protein